MLERCLIVWWVWSPGVLWMSKRKKISRDSELINPKPNPSQTVFSLYQYRKEDRLLNAKLSCQVKISLAILLWPLPSTRSFHLQNCQSLDVCCLLFAPFCVNSKWLCEKIPGDHFPKIFKPAHLSPTTVLKSKSLRSHSSLILMFDVKTEALALNRQDLCTVMLPHTRITA